MLKIRLQRVGRKNDPAFRIIVAEHTSSPKTGKFVEKVGTYNPKTKARAIDGDRVKHWLSVGAQASGTVHNMLISAGVIDGKKINVLPKKRPIVKEEAPVVADVTPAAAPVVETAVADEPVKEEPAAEVPAVEATPDAAPVDAGATTDAGASA